LDQSESLMQDLMTIAWRRDYLDKVPIGSAGKPAIGSPPGDPKLFKSRGSPVGSKES